MKLTQPLNLKPSLLLPPLLAVTLAAPAWANDDLEVTMEVMDSSADLRGNELVLDLVEDDDAAERERDGFFAGLFGRDERDARDEQRERDGRHERDAQEHDRRAHDEREHDERERDRVRDIEHEGEREHDDEGELADLRFEDTDRDFDDIEDPMRDAADEIELDDIREERERDFAENDHMQDDDMRERDDEIDAIDDLDAADEVDAVDQVDEMDDVAEIDERENDIRDEGDVRDDREMSDLNEEPANDEAV